MNQKKDWVSKYYTTLVNQPPETLPLLGALQLAPRSKSQSIYPQWKPNS